jgi:hypothetical protein
MNFIEIIIICVKFKVFAAYCDSFREEVSNALTMISGKIEKEVVGAQNWKQMTDQLLQGAD